MLLSDITCFPFLFQISSRSGSEGAPEYDAPAHQSELLDSFVNGSNRQSAAQRH
jgi:hypothetical protein